MLFTEEKKKREPPALPEDIVVEEDTEGIAELVIDVRKMLDEYDVIRLILPESPGEQITTEHGSELVFFQEETVS